MEPEKKPTRIGREITGEEALGLAEGIKARATQRLADNELYKGKNKPFDTYKEKRIKDTAEKIIKDIKTKSLEKFSFKVPAPPVHGENILMHEENVSAIITQIEKTVPRSRQISNQIIQTEKDKTTEKTIYIGGTESISSQEYNKELRKDSELKDVFAAQNKGIPDQIQNRFIRVKDKFYFPDNTLAFQDKGGKLIAKSENQEVGRSLINIAQHRDWAGITVKGSKDFKQYIWYEASMRDIPVQGYKPSEAEKAKLEKGKNNMAKENSIEIPKSVEKADAFRKESRGDVINKYPEMVPVYGTLAVADKFAQKSFSKEDRSRFMEITKEVLAKSIESGKEIPAVKIKVQDRAKLPEKARSAEIER